MCMEKMCIRSSARSGGVNLGAAGDSETKAKQEYTYEEKVRWEEEKRASEKGCTEAEKVVTRRSDTMCTHHVKIQHQVQERHASGESTRTCDLLLHLIHTSLSPPHSCNTQCSLQNTVVPLHSHLIQIIHPVPHQVDASNSGDSCGCLGSHSTLFVFG